MRAPLLFDFGLLVNLLGFLQLSLLFPSLVSFEKSLLMLLLQILLG